MFEKSSAYSRVSISCRVPKPVCFPRFYEIFAYATQGFLRKIAWHQLLSCRTDTEGEVSVFTEHVAALRGLGHARLTVRTFLGPCVPGSHYLPGITSDLCSRASLLPWRSADPETHWCLHVGFGPLGQGSKTAGFRMQMRPTVTSRLAPQAMAYTVNVSTAVLVSSFFQLGGTILRCGGVHVSRGTL